MRSQSAHRRPRTRPAWSRSAGLCVAVLLLSVLAAPGAAGQDAHFTFSIPEIEERMRGPFEIIAAQGSRMEDDRTYRVVLAFPDEAVMAVKWANAPSGGREFNNEPRYDAAAYEIQKLFLDESELVVPPTVLRAFPRDFVAEHVTDAPPTFSGVESVVVALQYWLNSVIQEDFWEPERVAQDTLYARAAGNLNILTFLIRHGDSNIGNFLVSRDGSRPRLFAVDNGIAFRSIPSNRGHEWREMVVERLPQRAVDRLRQLGEDDFVRALAVIVEFEERHGQLVVVTPGENISPDRGVRSRDGRFQLGLTAREISDVERRRRQLLRMVDRGKIQTF